MSLLIPTHLSFSKTLSSQNPFFLSKISRLSLHFPPPTTRRTTIIRMGGRIYPGGVSKLQWRRMKTRTAKQLFNAGLLRERQIYEMRKREELKASIPALERPWEVVEKAPNLFSVSADEEVKVSADRFQKAGGFDLWTEEDGPQLFQTPAGIPSARSFPKGVVPSVKPYGIVSRYDDLDDEEEDSDLESCEESESQNLGDVVRNVYNSDGSSFNGKLSGGALMNGRKSGDVLLSDSESGEISNSDENASVDRRRTKRNGRKLRRKRSGRRLQSGFGTRDSGQVGFDRKQRGVSTSTSHGRTRRISRSDGNVSSRKGTPYLRNSKSEVYDSLQKDSS